MQQATPSTSYGVNMPVVAPSQDGRLELFTVGNDYNLYHRWQFSDLSWSDWYSHGSPQIYKSKGLDPFSISLSQTSNGRLEFFAWDFDYGRVHAIQQVIPSGYWTGWQDLGAPNVLPQAYDSFSIPPAPVVNGQGNLELFVHPLYDQYQGTIYRNLQTAADGSWSGWIPFGPPSGISFLGPPAAATSQDGRVELFCVGNDGNLWHIWQTKVGGAGGAWSAWFSHGNPGTGFPVSAQPRIVPDADGRLELYIVGGDGALYRLPQLIVSGIWGGWVSHSTPPGAQLPLLDSKVAVGWSADGRREVFVVDNNGALWHLWQTDLNGNWSDWFSHGTPPGTQLWSGLTISLDRNDCLELFADAKDGNLHQLVQTVPNNGWSDWINFGQP